MNLAALSDHFRCDDKVNFILNGPSYSQISLTDGCGTGNCAGNPVYGGSNDNQKAVDYCQSKCGNDCQGFFFQKHNNGHEICGFYKNGMDKGDRVWHGHQ